MRREKEAKRALWIVVVTALAVAFVSATVAEARVTRIRPPRNPPYVISESGSYALDGNITVPDQNTTAIQITADDVTLNLNGFTISGPVVCTPSCTPFGGSGRGIDAPTANNVRVRNGTIRGMGSYAVYMLGSYNRVEDVTVTSNGAAIAVNEAAIIRDCIALSNGGPGIYADRGSRIIDSVATNNLSGGISGGESVSVSHSIASENGVDGIAVERGSLLNGNVARQNGHWALYIGTSGAALGNVASLSAAGLVTNGSIGYGQNIFWQNNGGNANQQGPSFSVQMGPNDCGDDTSCP